MGAIAIQCKIYCPRRGWEAQFGESNKLPMSDGRQHKTVCRANEEVG